MSIKTPFQSQWLGGNLQFAGSEIVGKAFYVDSVNGATTNYGSSWTDALTTVDAAINKCTANAGDIIYIAPWHVEAIPADTTLVMDVAGVTLQGVCQGNQRPTFTLGTATSATIPVSVANCRITGIKIISDLADVAVGITAGAAADNLQVDNCIITDGAAAKELIIGVSIAAACDGCRIVDNQFYTVDGGGCASAIKMVGESARTLIQGNIIFGDYSASGIDGSTAAQTIVNIIDNKIRNADDGAGGCIKLHASSTGWGAWNVMQSGGSIANCATLAGLSVCENYGSGAAGAQGVLEPVIDAD